MHSLIGPAEKSAFGPTPTDSQDTASQVDQLRSAEFERELIRSRTGEGRARAMARGIKFGRKPALTEFQRSEALKRRENGETCVDIARSLNVSHSTISRL
jgi:DNA invertase Pin-like site-specific DNA recombinase